MPQHAKPGQTGEWSLDDNVVIGYLVGRGTGSGQAAPALVLGPRARLRTGTVLYDGSVIGTHLETGHGVVIREECEIGDDVSVWSNTVIDYGCRIGNRVKIHAGCYIAQFTVLEDDVFLAPGVVIGNDLYPGNEDSARLMAGPTIEKGAQIGVNVTILPYVRIGAGALVGAGSVVSRDIPAGMVAYGNPAKPRRPVDDLPDITTRLGELDETRT